MYHIQNVESVRDDLFDALEHLSWAILCSIVLMVCLLVSCVCEKERERATGLKYMY